MQKPQPSLVEGIAISRLADHVYLLASGLAISLEESPETQASLVLLAGSIREYLEWHCTTPGVQPRDLTCMLCEDYVEVLTKDLICRRFKKNLNRS